MADDPPQYPVVRLAGLYAGLACLWEVTARKPGNVHRYRDFDDACFLDFQTSAATLQAVFQEAELLGGRRTRVSRLVLDVVFLRGCYVNTNTNLGIALLLAPLAKAPDGMPLRDGIECVLASLDQKDAEYVYQAIRYAGPAGLGQVENQDISAEPTLPLREVMALAADRDLVARQYANGFREVFDEGVPALLRGLEVTGCLEGAIITCHLSLMATHPDSLIARKRGLAEAEEASRRARALRDAGWPRADSSILFREFDAWLRAEGHGRNPGTTADLVTASIFVALREGHLTLPPSHPWTLPERLHI